MLCFLLQKPVKPVRYFLQAANAVFGLAAAAQFVVFSPPEHAEPSLNAVVPERCKHLQGFRQPAAVILFRMDKQGWGLHPIRVLQRRMFPQFGRIGPGGGPPDLIRGKVVADICRIAHGKPIGDTALSGRGLEAVCLADNPIGHKSPRRTHRSHQVVPGQSLGIFLKQDR